jgi:hypothetical protein
LHWNACRIGNANAIAGSRYRPTYFLNGRQAGGYDAFDSGTEPAVEAFFVRNQQEQTDGNARS